MGIFMSYSNRDGDAVRALARDLESARHAVWLDQDLRGGDAWWRAILKQIRTCDVFVLALSDNSLNSKPCRAELEYARALGIPVLPVQIGPVASLRTVAISEIQVVDYRERSASAGISLLGAVSECATQRRALPEPPPPPPPIPYEYLIRLGASVSAPELRPADQVAVIAQLRDGLENEEDEGVRRDIAALLRALRGRIDVTYRSASEIDTILAGVGADTSDGNRTGGPRTQPGPGPGDAWPPQRSPGSGSNQASGGAPYHVAGGGAAHQPPLHQPLSGPPPWANQPPAGLPGHQPTPSNGFSIGAMVLGVISLLFFPIILGPAAIVLAIVAINRKESLAKIALGVAIGGMVLGFILGAVVGAAAF